MKKQMGIIAMILTISILLSGCGGKTVEQKNDSLTGRFLCHENYPWYDAAKDEVLKTYPDINAKLNCYPLRPYTMWFSRQYQNTDITPLREYYDNITSDLRKDQAGDIIMGDATYLEWPEATPPDWQKLMQSGAFADLNPLAEEDAELDTTTYVKVNSDKGMASEEKWTIIPLLYDNCFVYTTIELAEQWDFPLPQPNEPTMPEFVQTSIVDFLDECAKWVEKYGDDPNAPSIMSDFQFRLLKSVVFDVCGLRIADYETGKVDFDNPTVKRILEALRTISTDIEDSGLGDRGIYEFEREAYKERRYLLYSSPLANEKAESPEGLRVIVPLDIDEKYSCSYAVRWIAVPASSQNQKIAYAYIQSLLSIDKGNYDDGYKITNNYTDLPPEHKDPNRKSFNIVLPSTWQYALSDSFDSYYAGNMETDEFMNQVQKRLEVYITE